MIRITRGSAARKKHKKIIKLNKSFRGSHSRLFRTASQQNKKALSYSYCGRRLKKRIMRTIWIKRINSNKINLKYSLFRNKLKEKNIIINRKIIAKIIELDNNTILKITK
uniref:Ribosomal protein L20 n=1 Tax=Phacus orbicularis TaxID=158829 RepID=A0A172F0W4_9EUGL|nr:ribosomal protein L20 [Phacus orbicularis]